MPLASDRLCLYCNTSFEPKRSTAKFCSTNCRVKAAKVAGVDSETGEIHSADNPLREAKKPTGVESADKSYDRGPQVVDKTTGKVNEVATAILQHKLEEPYDREANLKAFQKMGLDQVEFISTGIPDFDALTKIPRGRLTQIDGRYGVGKTTLCLNMIKGLKDRRVLYIDSESSLNPELLANLGLLAKNFTLYNESSYMEDIAALIREAVKTPKYDIIILDSVAMTTTRTRAESDITSKDIGQKASVINKLLELIMGDVRRSKTALVFINQVRDVIGGYVPQTYTPGGSGILYNASLMVNLKTIKSWRFPKDPKDGVYHGHEVEALIYKSKVNIPHRKAKFKLMYPQPIKIEDDTPVMAEGEF